MSTSSTWRTVLAVSLVAFGAVSPLGPLANEPLYVLDGEAIYRIVPGSEDVKVAEDVGPGVPTAISAPPPEYPPEIDRAWVVEVQAIIGQDGAVEEATVIGSRPFPDPTARWAAPSWVPALHESAVAAFEEREYRPVLLNGDPIRLRISVALVYNPPLPQTPSPNEGDHRDGEQGVEDRQRVPDK